jgi:prolipoprotein diacylglyceryl transferase
MLTRLLKDRKLAVHLTDQITWYVMLGAVIGARHGHVFFYEWPRYQQHPLEILKVWEGGLASHGGTLGIILALFLFSNRFKKQYPSLSFIRVMDLVSVPTALAAFFIRFGNFINQEIVGTATAAPWGVLFLHPFGGEEALVRHPVQLYEGFSYLATFGILWTLWKIWGDQMKPGFLVGTFLILVFGSRFFLEFFKLPLSGALDVAYLQTGQLLSIPFVLLGLFLLYNSIRQKMGKIYP